MNEQLLKELASKFGTTVDHLWQVMVRQAGIQACIDIVQYSIWLILFIALVCSTVYSFNKIKNEYDPRVITTGILGLVSALVGICLLSCSNSVIEDVITGLYNPEAWAIKQIISGVK